MRIYYKVPGDNSDALLKSAVSSVEISDGRLFFYDVDGLEIGSALLPIEPNSSVLILSEGIREQRDIASPDGLQTPVRIGTF